MVRDSRRCTDTNLSRTGASHRANWTNRRRWLASPALVAVLGQLLLDNSQLVGLLVIFDGQLLS
jgi:hypothetical protein